MADDHAPHALSCYGSRINRTPKLDILASGGMRFRNCFDTVSLCAPSRASLITGKYPHKNGFRRNEDLFDGTQQTFPKLLQQAGYETAIIGKWHLGTEPTGFDYFNVMPGHGRYWDCPLKEIGKEWEDGETGGDVHEGYLTDVLTNLSVDWMKSCSGDKPFCLMLHHKAPHSHYHYPKKYAELYKEDLPYPDTFLDDYESRGALCEGSCQWSKLENMVFWDLWGNEIGDRPPREDKMDFRRFAYQTVFKGYLRLVASLDDNVGRILDYLDSSGLSKNTIVIYTSDNGFFLGDHGLYNKMWMYEQSLGIPMIARFPSSIKAGTVSDEFVSLVDIAPTLLDYAGAEIPPDMQGHSIKPILEGLPTENKRDAHYYHYYSQLEVPSHFGLRTMDFKLICYYELADAVKWELFDLRNDRNEMKNVYDDPSYADAVLEMKKMLWEKQFELEDPVRDKADSIAG